MADDFSVEVHFRRRQDKRRRVWDAVGPVLLMVVGLLTPWGSRDSELQGSPTTASLFGLIGQASRGIGAIPPREMSLLLVAAAVVAVAASLLRIAPGGARWIGGIAGALLVVATFFVMMTIAGTPRYDLVLAGPVLFYFAAGWLMTVAGRRDPA